MEMSAVVWALWQGQECEHECRLQTVLWFNQIDSVCVLCSGTWLTGWERRTCSARWTSSWQTTSAWHCPVSATSSSHSCLLWRRKLKSTRISVPMIQLGKLKPWCSECFGAFFSCSTNLNVNRKADLCSAVFFNWAPVARGPRCIRWGGARARLELNSRARFSSNQLTLSLRIWVFRSGDHQT